MSKEKRDTPSFRIQTARPGYSINPKNTYNRSDNRRIIQEELLEMEEDDEREILLP